jgi:hypothetical protein
MKKMAAAIAILGSVLTSIAAENLFKEGELTDPEIPKLLMSIGSDTTFQSFTIDWTNRSIEYHLISSDEKETINLVQWFVWDDKSKRWDYFTTDNTGAIVLKRADEFGMVEFAEQNYGIAGKPGEN